MYKRQKLKRANYHILGKANLSEWANFRSDDSVSGWSSLGGQTKHFIDDAYNPCGSSSGSAVAVSMGIVDIAIGTETNGSISCPSSVNGIVGMKPTTGLVSRSGIVPISSSQDTAGPMGATIDIVAKTLEVISMVVKKTIFFRWHDSGDIQDLKHLAKIFEVAKRTPGIALWLPTREAQILKRVKINEVPRNLVIRFSSHMVDQGPVSFWPWTSTVTTDAVSYTHLTLPTKA